MRNAVFTLIPFQWPAEPHPTLSGRLAIASHTLRIEYDLSGLNRRADLPAPSPNPARRLQLWRHTCFELLWGPLHHPNYWELNASPAGHWNILALADYRHGMTEEPRIADVQLSSQHRPRGLSLSCTVPIADTQARSAPAASRLPRLSASLTDNAPSGPCTTRAMPPTSTTRHPSPSPPEYRINARRSSCHARSSRPSSSSSSSHPACASSTHARSHGPPLITSNASRSVSYS